MAKWEWLSKSAKPYTWLFFLRVGIKTGVLFLILNAAFILCNPLSALGRLPLYNTVLDGRERLPYGENPADSYNLSLNNLNAMFASHVVSQDKADDEYRVLVIGDSSTWGFLLEPQDTLVGQLNAANLKTNNGKIIRFYNLGYPTMSLTKDLMLLDKGMEYAPDMVMWLVTLESFPRDRQVDTPIVQNNAETVRRLIREYDLGLDLDDSRFIEAPEFPDNTIWGQRRALADLVRLQIYGIMWTTTGIDQYYPETYQLRQSNFSRDISWRQFEEPRALDSEVLAFEVIQAGIQRAGDIPFLVVNEPMFISVGRNSDLHYNAFYPRWAYDSYRENLAALALAEHWIYLDLWDHISPREFTDSPVHMTPTGMAAFREILIPYVLIHANSETPRWLG